MKPPKKTALVTERKIALCYIRQSYTRIITRDRQSDTRDREEDMNSPERQKANITLLCERKGWIPEWYQDAKGHKSGQHEDNRPEWLRLKARLGDPDVAAVVANDLSRLHRKFPVSAR